MSKNNKKMMIQMGMWGSLVGMVSTGFIDKKSHIWGVQVCHLCWAHSKKWGKKLFFYELYFITQVSIQDH
ncbi:MAG: hypothetical protein HQK67_03105 [Desulfamplus sp.]|nr:hypothetical protein [Desulfamplus sp.]